MESGGGWAPGVMGAGGGRGVTRIFIFISEHNTELFIKKKTFSFSKSYNFLVCHHISLVLSMAEIKCKEAVP